MSEAEETFAYQLKVMKLPVPVREYRFALPRKYRFDFCWPDYMIAVEIEGGIYKAESGHRSISGMLRDLEKYNLAAWLGWRLFRFTTAQVESGEAINYIEQWFNSRRDSEKANIPTR